ncbi:MAG: aspartate carbamoyltransferase [Ruminococcaceae bacterium]|nr:aspartate carbamoyltransferase [Oscillospiraceae bacterium]
MRDLIDFNEMSIPEWEKLNKLAFRMKKSPAEYRDVCKGKIMATLFYEPSTRTQMSFQTAMMRLGGKVIGFSDPGSSSVAKGETLRDTVKIVTSYADILVIRHPIEGAAYASSLYSHTPVINAGDGGHLHPTQTLTDLMTIWELKGKCSGLTIGCCGDLLNGRTVHSLLRAMMRFPDNKFVLISTPELEVPAYVMAELREHGCDVREATTLEECIGELDILYMTRIQRERFASAEEYQKQAGVYRLTADKMALAKSDLAVLHPLPKVDEIAPELDDDPRCVYFEQAENGVYIRMALVAELIGAEKRGRAPAYAIPEKHICKNPKCVTAHEPYLPILMKNVENATRCVYCDQKIK